MLTVTQAIHTEGSCKGPLTPGHQCRCMEPKPNCGKCLPVNLGNGLPGGGELETHGLADTSRRRILAGERQVQVERRLRGVVRCTGKRQITQVQERKEVQKVKMQGTKGDVC